MNNWESDSVKYFVKKSNDVSKNCWIYPACWSAIKPISYCI